LGAPEVGPGDYPAEPDAFGVGSVGLVVFVADLGELQVGLAAFGVGSVGLVVFVADPDEFLVGLAAFGADLGEFLVEPALFEAGSAGFRVGPAGQGERVARRDDFQVERRGD
jgi:hypothetical protein